MNVGDPPRRLLPVRHRAATRLLARRPRGERPGEPADLPRGREPAPARRRRRHRPPLPAPAEASPASRGAIPACRPTPAIVLWGGGIWNWLDPLTLVRAWPRGDRPRAGARLVFLGTRHPNPASPATRWPPAPRPWPAEPGEPDRTHRLHRVGGPRRARGASRTRPHVGVSLHPDPRRDALLDPGARDRLLLGEAAVVVTEGDVASEWVRAAPTASGVLPPGRRRGRCSGPRRHPSQRPRSDWELGFSRPSTRRSSVGGARRAPAAGTASPEVPGSRPPPRTARPGDPACPRPRRQASSCGRSKCSAGRDPWPFCAARPCFVEVSASSVLRETAPHPPSSPRATRRHWAAPSARVQRLAEELVAPVRRRGHRLHHELLFRRGVQPPGAAADASEDPRSGTVSASAASRSAPVSPPASSSGRRASPSSPPLAVDDSTSARSIRGPSSPASPARWEPSPADLHRRLVLPAPPHVPRPSAWPAGGACPASSFSAVSTLTTSGASSRSMIDRAIRDATCYVASTPVRE